MIENSLTLFELNNRIKSILSVQLSDSLWIKAEISDVKENQNGHCYIELIEKAKDSENIISRAKATIWSSIYRMLKPYFETTTGRTLVQGMKILIKVSVEYHELYGLSLNIRDIEPSYTVGDLELQRQKIIKQLTTDGVIEMNKQLPFPLVPQRIAIISSRTAAGYEDFINQLENNPYNYKYYYKLFDSSMQGANTEESIIQSLDKIYENEHIFDLVVIIRGGGSKSDLSSFDSYNLAYNITQFPLPVITGIGHERDNCVVDIVAHSRLKTPTAVAEFIINKTSDFENSLDDATAFFVETFSDKIEEEKSKIETLIYNFIPVINKEIYNNTNRLNIIINKAESITKDYIQLHKQHLNNNANSLLNQSKAKHLHYKNDLNMIEKTLFDTIKQSLNNQTHKVELYQNKIDLINPVNVLKRGYSITLINGKIVRTKANIKKGDIIETKLSDGKIESSVTDIMK